MTSGALTLCVAGGAQVPLGIGLDTVLAEEVAIVHHMALRRRHFSWEINVASAAVSRVPLALVSVTTEAGGMLDADVVRVDRHVHVASHAIPGARLAVNRM